MIKALHRQGWAQRKIARELDVDPKMMRRALHQETRPAYRRGAQPTTLLTGYEAFIRRCVVEVDYNARCLFEELRNQGTEGAMTE